MTENTGINDRTFPRSVQSLARLALQESGAVGFAIYQLDPDGGEPVLKCREGLEAPGEVSFPLNIDDGVTGRLSFVFRDSAVNLSTQLLLEKVARAIESVWHSSLAPEKSARIALRIAELEAELADEKIADRASGMLQESASSRSPIEAIARHVESVLRISELENALFQLERDLAEQLAERRLTSRAKAVLQSRYGISEEQAHVHLRIVSRTNRMRLRDVAQAMIENPVLYASHRMSAVQSKGV
jgi:hypothetical protein